MLLSIFSLTLFFNSVTYAVTVSDCAIDQVQTENTQPLEQNLFYLYQLSPWSCQLINGLDKTVDVMVLSFSLVGNPATWESLGLASIAGTSVAAPLAVTALVAGVGVASIKLTVLVTKEECFESEINEKVKASVEHYLKTHWQQKTY